MSSKLDSWLQDFGNETASFYLENLYHGNKDGIPDISTVQKKLQRILEY